MSTAAEIDAGADAVREFTEKYGVSAFVSDDQCTELSKAVLEAARKAKDK